MVAVVCSIVGIVVLLLVLLVVLLMYEARGGGVVSCRAPPSLSAHGTGRLRWDCIHVSLGLIMISFRTAFGLRCDIDSHPVCMFLLLR